MHHLKSSDGMRPKYSSAQQVAHRRLKSGRTHTDMSIAAALNMPKDAVLRKVRKGTKSCVECRQRKIKCIWASDGAELCNNCEARGRPCVSQVYSSASNDAIRLTSRERIGKLESVVLSLHASIARLEAKLALEPIQEAHNGDAHAGTSAAAAATDYADDASDSDASENESLHPNTHLHQLFDNSLLGTPRPPADYGGSGSPPRREAGSPASHRAARRALQDLLPPKADVAIMEPFVGVWMALVTSIFPSTTLFNTGQDMLGRYESMLVDDVHPLAIANYLCPLAITIHHIPPKLMQDQFTGTKDGHAFVRQVSDVMEQFCFNDDAMLSSVEGIDMALMFLRLQMLRGRVRKVWVCLRRIIAIAEMLGVPRAAQSPLDGGSWGSPELREAAIVIWDCVISVDRMAGLIWGLPVGTSSYKTTVPTDLMLNGQVNLMNVLLRMSASAATVIEIDELFAAQRPLHEISEKIMMADQEWRAMVDLTPPRWWHSPPLSVDSILLYWYQYIGVRIHIQLALRNDERNTFAYSHMRCLEACRNMAIRYPLLRSALPTEFFAGRVLDIQALTPAIFLLHTCYKPGTLQQTGPESPATLVNGILKLTDKIKDKTGGSFAKQLGTAIRSVIDILESSNRGEARMMTLQVPTLGRINVGARLHTGCTTHRSAAIPTAAANSMTQYPPVTFDSTLTAADFDMANNLDWIMEISDDYSYLTQDVTGGADLVAFDSFDMPE